MFSQRANTARLVCPNDEVRVGHRIQPHKEPVARRPGGGKSHFAPIRSKEPPQREAAKSTKGEMPERTWEGSNKVRKAVSDRVFQETYVAFASRWIGCAHGGVVVITQQSDEKWSGAYAIRLGWPPAN